MGAFISLIITEGALVISGFLSVLTALKTDGTARTYAIINAILAILVAIISFAIVVFLG